MACIWKGKESIQKPIFTEFMLSEKDSPQMKIKVRKSNSAACVLLACTLCTFPTHWVSSQQKTTASKNSIAFLFSQLHFNNVTLNALFHGSHLVMGSKRYAVYNQQITLTSWISTCLDTTLLLYNFFSVSQAYPFSSPSEHYSAGYWSDCGFTVWFRWSCLSFDCWTLWQGKNLTWSLWYSTVFILCKVILIHASCFN